MGGGPSQEEPLEKKPKPEAKKSDWPRRTRPEAVLLKPAEGVCYAAISKNLKKHVKPDELGVTVLRIRETRSKDLPGGNKMFQRRQRAARYRLERGYWYRGRDCGHRAQHRSRTCRRCCKRLF